MRYLGTPGDERLPKGQAQGLAVGSWTGGGGDPKFGTTVGRPYRPGDCERDLSRDRQTDQEHTAAQAGSALDVMNTLRASVRAAANHR